MEPSGDFVTFQPQSVGNQPSNSVGNTRLSTRMTMDWDKRGDIQYDNQMEDLLEQLPSRQLESIADMASKSLKRKQPESVYRGAMVRRNEDDVEEEIVRTLEQDLSDDEDAADNLDAALRNMQTTLRTKRHIKKRLSSKRSRKIGRCRYLMYWLGMVWQHFKYSMKNASGLFDLWRSHLVTIEGYFGSGVVSYFIFLKWVLVINIPLFLVTFSFLVLPQLLFRLTQRDPPNYEGGKSFEGIELLTGRGFFEETEMYYGFYTNESVEAITDVRYQMRYAYLLTCGGYYLFCLFILAYSYLHSYRKYYIESSGALSNYYFSMVLCGWDYGIVSQETAILKQKGIFNELKEYLSGRGIRRTKSQRVKVKATTWFRRLFVWIIVLVLLGASGYTTYVVSVENSLTTALADETSIPVVSPLAMPVVISSLHFVIPMIFTFLEAYEEYTEPKTELYIHMFRDMALKASILAVLVVFWFQRAASELQCWETFVGQEIYRLVIVDLIFTLSYSFIMEFCRKLLSLKCESVERAEFAVGRHTLELIYSQSLCWLGVYYCPIIPLVAVVKLIIIFYVKRFSVVNNCQSSLKPWRASRTHTVFVGYLFGFFLLCVVQFGCSVFLMNPSKGCGLYQNVDHSFEVVESLVSKWKEESSFLNDFFNFITSPGFIVALFVFFSVVLYYMRIIMLSHHSVVEQLKMQLKSEGRDKRFLMDLLNQVKLRGRRVSKHPGPSLFSAVNALSTSTGTHGKVFVRSVAESMLTSPQSN